MVLDLGSVATRFFSSALKNELFHPNKQGHAAWADTLITWSQSQSVDPALLGKLTEAEQRSFWSFLARFARSAWKTVIDLAPILLRPVDLSYLPAIDHHWTIPGAGVHLVLRDLAPGSSALVTVRSEPIALGELFVGEDGVASGTVTLPELSGGSYELIIEGYNENYELVGTVVGLQVCGQASLGCSSRLWFCSGHPGTTALIAWLISKARRNAAVSGGGIR